METYVINGQEVEYDTFDLANMELFDCEVRRIEAAARGIDPKQVSGSNYLAVLREQAENILDFFDTVIGEGTSRRVFGGKVNLRDITEAYRKFTQDVLGTVRGGFAAPQPAPPANREQRRAAAREQRREQARQRAAEKAKPVTDEA